MKNRLETFRDILDCGKEKALDLSEYFNIEKDEYLNFRTYRVISNHQPIMLITEKFSGSGMEIEL